jgi:cytochrome c oxidase accessory protein FixG
MKKSDVARPPEPTSSRTGNTGVILEAEEHVLATLEKDGSRRWLFPRLAQGNLWKLRRVVAYVLIAVFAVIPHLRLNGKPLVLLDIPARRFTIFGLTFLPTDTFLLALFLICVFLAIILATALVGRVWCGWGCPQTVFMEFVFRPVDRLFDGTKGKGGKPKGPMPLWKRAARFGVYLLLAMFLAHTFLAYFIGTERLAQWIRLSPFEHPIPFLIMVAATGAMLFDFMYFREQLCLIACPYGRFQSALLDRKSLIVAYDVNRGEPRGKKTVALPIAEERHGDCIDCGLCVQVCPTGIDIRNGLQLECINCTQCIDVCHDVMLKVNRPVGLIRYASQDTIAGKGTSWLRPRLIIYPVALIAVLSVFMSLLLTKKSFDANIYRNFGNPFSLNSESRIQNSLRLDLVNRTDKPTTYDVKVLSPTQVQLQFVEGQAISLPSNGSHIFPIIINAPYECFSDGLCEVKIEIADSNSDTRILKYEMMGPESPPKPADSTKPSEDSSAPESDAK